MRRKDGHCLILPAWVKEGRKKEEVNNRGLAIVLFPSQEKK
jgi:hypothetical protein